MSANQRRRGALRLVRKNTTVAHAGACLIAALLAVASFPACGAEEEPGPHKHGTAGEGSDHHDSGNDQGEKHGRDAAGGDEHPGGRNGHDHGDEHGHNDEHGTAEGGHGDEHSDEVKLSPEAIKRYGVKVEPAAKQALTDTVAAAGRVAFNADALAHVGSPVAGRLSELQIRLGDAVKKGDPLLTIESPELAEAQSDFRSKRAAMHAARSAFERAKKLLTQAQGISLGEVQKREAELKTAEAAESAAEGKLRLFGLAPQTIDTIAKSGEVDARFSVTAPISGTVVERNAVLGEIVTPDRESLIVLADLSTLWVIADLPESQLKGVGVGARARVTVPAAPGEVVEGSVALVAPTLDPATRTAKVRIEVENRGSLLKPGMFARADIAASAGGTGEMLAVPQEAIQTVEGSPAVFVPVKGEENTFAKRQVTIGPAVGRLIPVLSGLQEGELVVTTGTFILKAELGKAGAEHQH